MPHQTENWDIVKPPQWVPGNYALVGHAPKAYTRGAARRLVAPTIDGSLAVS